MVHRRSARSRIAILAPLVALTLLGTACDRHSEEPAKQKEPLAPGPSATQAASTSPAPKEAPVAAASSAAAPALPPMKHPADNPTSAEKVALGHQLFFDKRLSVDGSRSCYSCHQNEDGNGGHEPLAIGAEGKKLTRHSPTIWNVGYLTRFYWDGRADSLEAQALGAWGGGNMGVGKEGLEAKAQELGKIPGYQKQFKAVFGEEGATAANVAKAIASYERTLVCDKTAFDRFAAGDSSALDAKQKQGWALFSGKAGCQMCHNPPFFSSAFNASEGTYYNLGIGTAGKEKKDVDPGRQAVTNDDHDWARFKVPTLRNISRSAPYFHDGSVATLEKAVRFVAAGGHPNDNLSGVIFDRALSDEEIGALVAFLGSLDCEAKLEEPKLP